MHNDVYNNIPVFPLFYILLFPLFPLFIYFSDSRLISRWGRLRWGWGCLARS